MDFFKQQDSARFRSLILLALFAIAMIVLTAFVNVLASVVSLLLGQSDSFWHFSLHAKVITGLLWLTISAGCFFRWLDVRNGGRCLATRFGASEALRSSRNDRERMLLDVVAEISVAASVLPPDAYILRNEPIKNAFVVGSNNDVVLVVTSGLLEALDREELQGVVGHEIGHMAQGDLVINMRLLVAMGGLLAIDEVGLTLGARKDEPLHPASIVGWVMRVFGSVGVMLARVIRAAFSRNREFLADASSIQYTRDPDALASALSRFEGTAEDRCLSSVYSQELAHLCFQVQSRSKWLSRLLATHPPLSDRIAAIDPHFEVKRRAQKKTATDNRWRSSQQRSMAMVRGVVAPGGFALADVGSTDSGQKAQVFAGVGVAAALMSSGMLSSGGGQIGLTGALNGASNGASNGDYGSEKTGLSNQLELSLPNAGAWLAALFAIFASQETAHRRHYFNSIAFAYEKGFAQRVENMCTQLGDELQDSQLEIIDYVVPRLKKVIKADNRRRLLLNLEKLLEVEGESTLFNYAALQLIRRKFDVEFPVLDKVRTQPEAMALKSSHKSLDDIVDEVALLLGLIVEASGNNSERLQADYEKVLRSYTREAIPRRTANDPGVVKQMQRAFQAMYMQPQIVRESFLSHCAEICRADFFTTRHEHMLMNLFAASLNLQETHAQAA